MRDAWEGFKRGFVLAYGVRAGLGIMTRLLTLLRKRQFSDVMGWRLLSETGLVYRCDAFTRAVYGRDGES